MPQAHNWYSASAEGVIAALWMADAMKVALMKPTFVPDRDAQKLWSDISAQEVASGSGYTTGGQALTGKATVYDPASDTTHLKADNGVWPGSTFDTSYAVVYDSTTGVLWSIVDFGGMKGVSNGQFVINWDVVGLLDLVAP